MLTVGNAAHDFPNLTHVFPYPFHTLRGDKVSVLTHNTHTKD